MPGNRLEQGSAAAGLHIVLWLPFLRPRDEAALIRAARDEGVGLYPVSPLFSGPRTRAQPRPAGFVLGYASLTVEQIERGMSKLGKVFNRARPA